MAKNQNVEHVILDMIDSAFRTVKTVPLNLGGFGGAGGGVGQPPGGYIGQLPQIRVAYDSTEAETLFTPLSGMSLVDNLNHIRYRINDLEENGGSALIVRDWDGVPTVTDVTHITFSGGVIVSQLSAGHALVRITASGGSSFTGDANSIVLTDGAGALDTMPWLKHGGSAGAEYIEFGADVIGKDSNAGKLGYQTYGSGFFYIVGAAYTGNPRRVKVFDDLYVDSDLYINGGQAISAGKQVTNGDSHDHNGGDGAQISHANLSSIGTNTHAQIDTHIATGAHVTNGDSHNHVGGDGAALNYTELIGTFGGSVKVPASTTYYAAPYKIPDATANNFPWDEAGVLSRLLVRIGETQSGTGSYVVTLYVNGSASALTVTIAAGSGAASYIDTSNTVTISAGDTLRWQIVNNASVAAALLTAITMKLTKQTA